MSFLVALKIAVAVLSVFAWLLSMYLGRQVIRDANGDPYLVRYFIYRPDWARYLGLNPKKMGRIYLHHIVRSDYDRALHDHPWTFRSIMLWGSYLEYSTREDFYKRKHYSYPFRIWRSYDNDIIAAEFKAPCYNMRGADWRHRLVLPAGKTTVTLVFIGPVTRSWGFWTTLTKWCHWKKYDTGKGICEEPEVEF